MEQSEPRWPVLRTVCCDSFPCALPMGYTLLYNMQSVCPRQSSPASLGARIGTFPSVPSPREAKPSPVLQKKVLCEIQGLIPH